MVGLVVAALDRGGVVERVERVRAGVWITKRRGTDLDSWITAVRSEDMPALHAFTDGLSKDYAAVVAGLTLPYSNGPEGVINKIKMLKRQTYGKARFSLLRKRILLAD